MRVVETRLIPGLRLEYEGELKVFYQSSANCQIVHIELFIDEMG